MSPFSSVSPRLISGTLRQTTVWHRKVSGVYHYMDLRQVGFGIDNVPSENTVNQEERVEIFLVKKGDDLRNTFIKFGFSQLVAF